jgi:hypothetical protein
MELKAQTQGPRDPLTSIELTYARWLDWGTRIGLALLVASFFAYAFELVSPHVPFDELARSWVLPVDDYRAAVGAPAGWSWIFLAAYGDYLNYFGIVFLALVTALCYARILPALFGARERMYALIAILEIAVLAAAIAGFAAGH